MYYPRSKTQLGADAFNCCFKGLFSSELQLLLDGSNFEALKS